MTYLSKQKRILQNKKLILESPEFDLLFFLIQNESLEISNFKNVIIKIEFNLKPGSVTRFPSAPITTSSC